MLNHESNPHSQKSVTRYDTESQATIYARLRDGRQLDLVAPTRLTINPNLWDDKAEQVKSKVVCDEAMRTRYNNEARRLKTYIERAYQNRPEETVSKGWLKEALDQYYNPQKYNLEQVSAIKPTLTALFDEFLEKHRLSEVRKRTIASSSGLCSVMNSTSGLPRWGRKTSRWMWTG